MAKIIGITCFLSCIAFLSFFICYNKKLKFIHPSTFFFALWTLITGLSLLSLYNIKQPSTEAYTLIFAMLVSFFIGSIIGNKIKFIFHKFKSKKTSSNNRSIKWKIFYAICALIVIFNLIDIFLIIVNLAKGTPMWQIRNWTLEPYGSINPILSRRSFVEELLRTLVCSPMMIILPAVASYYWFNSQNKVLKKRLMITTAVVLCLSALSGGGGRLIFFFFIICICASYYNARKRNIIKKANTKNRKVTIIILCSSLALMAIFTIARTGLGNLFKQFYTYFALPPTLLSLWLPTLQKTSHTFGLLTTFGIHSYFFRILSMIGLQAFVPTTFTTAFNTMLNAEKFLQVGYGPANAFVTPIYYFYTDGGIIFVIIASLLFGVLISYIAKRIMNNVTAKNFVLYSLIMYGIFVSFIRAQTVIPGYFISFLMALWIFEEKQPNYNYKDILATTTQKKLSIIIPVYNGELYLKNQVQNLLKIKNIDYEIIIVNDGSTDKTKEIATKLCKKNPNIKLVTTKRNYGLSHARNSGFKAARGDYVITADIDDIVNPLMYELLLKNATIENADISMCNYYESYPNSNTINSKYQYSQATIQNPQLTKLYLCDKISNNIWDKIIKRDIAQNIIFNEKLAIGEDILYCLELFTQVKNVSQLNARLYGYVQNPNSTMHTISPKLTEYKTMLEYIPVKLRNKLSSKYPDQFEYFELEMTVRGIHAISLATNKDNKTQSIVMLSNFYTTQDLQRIVQNKLFSKQIRLEMWVLLKFGVKTHLKLMPAYKLIKELSR